MMAPLTPVTDEFLDMLRHSLRIRLHCDDGRLEAELVILVPVENGTSVREETIASDTIGLDTLSHGR